MKHQEANQLLKIKRILKFRICNYTGKGKQKHIFLKYTYNLQFINKG